MTGQSPYDAFAATYNRHWGNEFAPRVFPILEQLVLRELPVGSRILDLCCGTGQFAGTLTGFGYRVTGVDNAAEMLRFARENAPGAEFVHADARSFSLPDKFDVVISVFDSLNHILSIEELGEVFVGVLAALEPGGVFFFDLNMAGGYFLTWNDNFGIVEDDLVCVVRSGYDSTTRTAEFKTTIFSLQGTAWQRSEVILLQKCYSDTEVRSALKTAGFRDIRAYAYNDKGDFAELTEEAERAFFICRKAAKANHPKKPR